MQSTARTILPRIPLPPLVALVALAAGLLRLGFADLSPFGHDEALEAIRARPIWWGEFPVESEITSWFIPDPPGMLYFFALAEAFPRPAVARVLLVGLLNVLAVALTFRLTQRYFGLFAALVAGLAYAVNPWAVIFGQQPWVITQPALTAGMLLAACAVVMQRAQRWIVLFFVLGALQTQTHLLMVLFAPAAVLTLALFPRRWLRPAVVPAAVAAVLVVLPYAGHLWSTRDDLITALGRGERGLTLALDGTAARLLTWLLSGQQLQIKLGITAPAVEWLSDASVLLWAPLAAALMVGLSCSIGACLRRLPAWEAHLLLLLWGLCPLLLMTFQSSAVYIHYVLVMLPVPFVWMGIGAAAVLAWARRARPGAVWPSRAVCAALAMPMVAHAALVCAYYWSLDQWLRAPRTGVSPLAWQAALNQADVRARALGIGEIHGLPLRYWQTVADRTKPVAGSGDDVVVYTGIQDEGNLHLDKRRKAISYLLGPELVARFPLEGTLIVAGGSEFLVMTVPEQDVPRPAVKDATRVVEVPLPGTSGATRVWQTRAQTAREAVQPRWRSTARFQAGVRLLGMDAPPRAQPGQSLALTTHWYVERRIDPQAPIVVPFVGLIDSDGAPLAEVRRGGLPSDSWLLGDIMSQQATLNVPPDLARGEYRLVVGLTTPDGFRDQLVEGPPADVGSTATIVSALRVD
ncbi:MAG: hypothetical protein U0821_17370 [Chloroflexota bacterium]